MGRGVTATLFTMARDLSKLAKKARERLNDNGVKPMANQKQEFAPPRAKKAKYLRDADGNLYLWTAELAERGDLVAAYDPDNPEMFAKDSEQIKLNRQLEVAREKAQMEEAARLEAERKAKEAEARQAEADQLAQANQQNLNKLESQLEQEREKHAKQLAEMQAKLDAMAKAQAKAEVPEVPEVPEEKPAKRPRKKAKAEPKVEENNDDLSEFDS